MPRQKSAPSQLHQAVPASASASASQVPGSTLILRVRHPDGTDRLSVHPMQRLKSVREQLAELHNVGSVARILLFRDVGCTEALDDIDDDEAIGPEGLGFAHGDMISMKMKPQPASAKAKRPGTSTAEGSGAGAASSAKRVKSLSGGEFTRDGKTPRDIAVSFMILDAKLSGEALYSQMSAAARVDAVRTGRVETETSMKGKKQMLTVRFVGNRKRYEERGPSYTLEELVSIVREISTRQTTSSRRTSSSSSHLLNAEEIARRSPAMFWSLHTFAPGGTFEERVEAVLALARADV
eukprot:CAMPEP_0185189232 /NCGR_PEP_ID=MMETSP1140-20130426/5907_1 /TAXON_ID=298111 /ORGANISM="Pavlova sp., Strain CCMP459" /LENGTH=294 /DNA_ID=CAMNT_0027755781 /DNA_START=53 /DNA_END=937 /DNA_ORIENTATION=+